MRKILFNIVSCILCLFLSYSSADFVLASDNPVSKSYNSEVDKEKLFFETPDIESSDQIIRDHLTESFPIISEEEINKVIQTKSIVQIENKIIDSLNAQMPAAYKVSFEVPKNFLVDTAKILWELNIPGFESKLYQLYNGQQIYVDTWPNVVGTISDKTFTGNFQAYKIRNWPFYKDPEPSKAHLPPTKPGPGNPLGLFVVHYDENSLRYFHGTNKNGLLSNKMRNLSHGCVRNDNDNIQKMKEFIIRKVVKTEDLSFWLNSKKTMIYELDSTEKFSVTITYKTFDMDKDNIGNYIILYKDIYNYSSGRINDELNNIGLVTLTNKENLIAEYRKKFGKDISDDALGLVMEYLVNNGEEYEKYYVDELKTKFMIQN